MWKWSWRKKWSKIIRRWVHLNGNSLWVRLCIWDIVFGGKKSSSRSAVWTNIDHLGPLKCINWTMFLILVVGDFSRFAYLWILRRPLRRCRTLRVYTILVITVSIRILYILKNICREFLEFPKKKTWILTLLELWGPSMDF